MKQSKLLVSIVAAMALVLAGATDLSAQYSQRGRRASMQNAFGIGLTLIDPVGEFANYVDIGGGLELYGLIGLGRNSPFSLRVNGSFVLYGHERYSEPFNDRIGRVWVDVTTDNTIVTLGLGPQLNMDLGGVMLYGFGTAGFSYFSTQSSVGDHYYDSFSSTNFDDFTFALAGGGGMLIRLSGRRSRPVFLDLGASFVDNGRTLYLREGGITELGGGRVRLQPISSQTDAVQYRVGITIGIGKSGDNRP